MIPKDKGYFWITRHFQYKVMFKELMSGPYRAVLDHKMYLVASVFVD